jgi:hypothetical protein
MPREKTQPDPGAVPRRFRDKLIPACAVGVPDPIAQAAEQLRVAGLAAEAASVRRVNADAEDRRAKQADADAAIAAVQRGEEAPASTGAEKRIAYDKAVQTEQAAKEIARRAEIAYERAVRQHCGSWIPLQREHAAGLIDQVVAQIDDIGATLDRATESVNLVKALRQDPIRGTVDQARRLSRGGVLRANGNGRPVPEILAELREAIAGALPMPLRTAEERAEQERATSDHRRSEVAMSSGGVFVPGGYGG